jgi:hypothetical protein
MSRSGCRGQKEGAKGQRNKGAKGKKRIPHFAPLSLCPFAPSLCVPGSLKYYRRSNVRFTSSLKDGSLRVPVIMIGRNVPAPSRLNKGSTILRKNDFTPVVV